MNSSSNGQLVYGPTYEEMRDPSRQHPDTRAAALAARNENPLDPVNLFDMTWHEPAGGIAHIVIPPALTGVSAPIAMLTGKRFPTGSHKVGPAYSILVEKQVAGIALMAEGDA